MKLSKLMVISAIFFCFSAFGETAYWNANVERTLIDDENFGGCMALVLPWPSDTGLECPPNWVTFSCSGDYTTVEMGNRMFQAAQLALMTRTKVLVQVDDTKKHNGYCYARRIDNLPN